MQLLKITPQTACQHGAVQQKRQNFNVKVTTLGCL